MMYTKTGFQIHYPMESQVEKQEGIVLYVIYYCKFAHMNDPWKVYDQWSSDYYSDVFLTRPKKDLVGIPVYVCMYFLTEGDVTPGNGVKKPS